MVPLLLLSSSSTSHISWWRWYLPGICVHVIIFLSRPQVAEKADKNQINNKWFTSHNMAVEGLFLRRSTSCIQQSSLFFGFLWLGFNSRPRLRRPHSVLDPTLLPFVHIFEIVENTMRLDSLCFVWFNYCHVTEMAERRDSVVLQGSCVCFPDWRGKWGCLVWKEASCCLLGCR